MEAHLVQFPDAKVGLDQLDPGFDTCNTIAVRKAIEDQVQPVLSARTNRPTRSPPPGKAPMRIVCAPISNRRH
jgi:hypothetical protein